MLLRRIRLQGLSPSYISIASLEAGSYVIEFIPITIGTQDNLSKVFYQQQLQVVK